VIVSSIERFVGCRPMPWMLVVGVVAVLLVPLALWLLLCRRWFGVDDVPEDVGRLLFAWRAAQCKAEIRAVAAMVRRQLRAELDNIERRERGSR
jgi:hypothetical protein